VRSVLLLLALVPQAYPQPRPTQITIAEAVEEAIRSNPGLIAVRLGLPVADAARITAGLRPNPVVSYSSDHLDWLGTGFDDKNGAGPPEIALRVDMPSSAAESGRPVWKRPRSSVASPRRMSLTRSES